MSFEDEIYTKLNADSTLLASLTGGLFRGETIKSVGINRTNTPTAYATAGTLKTLGVVRGRDINAIPAIKTPKAGIRMVRQVVEVYLYADADAGWTTLNTAKDRVLALLDMKPLTGAFPVQFVNEVVFRETPLQNACAIRLEFAVNGRGA